MTKAIPEGDRINNTRALRALYLVTNHTAHANHPSTIDEELILVVYYILKACLSVSVEPSEC